MYTIPQSPRWLALRGRTAEAKASLERVGVSETDAMLAEFARAAEDGAPQFRREAVRRGVSAADRAGHPARHVQPALGHQRDPLLPQRHLRGRGLQRLSNDLQAVAIGAANLIATVIALRVIDRVGRKKLLLIGSIGTACALAGVAVIFATGQGKGLSAAHADRVHLVLRVFAGRRDLGVPRRDLPHAGALARPGAGQRHALGNERDDRADFPMVAAYTQALPFAFFAACMVVQFFVVLAIFPETRGVELEKMDQALEQKTGAGA